MSSKEDEWGCATLTWEIQNISLLLSVEEEAAVCWTPYWKTEHTGKSVWRRHSIYLRGENMHLQLSAAECLHLDRCEISLISFSREIPLKLYGRGSFDWYYNIERDAVFGEKSKSILPNDTLTLRFKMWEKTIRKREFRIDSILQNFSYLWNIKEFEPDCFHNKYIVEENFLFRVSLDGNSEKGTYKFIFGEASSIECDVSSLNCQLSAKTVHMSVIRESFDDNKNRVYEIEISPTNPNLDLQIESIIAVHRGCQEVSKALGDDFLLLYKDKLFSDTTLNAEGKSFHVHRNILSARSPVFRAMFEKDEMSEGHSGVVDIDDVDSETVDRMLVYLYGDSLESVQQWEEASALYYAADKYGIKPLKHKCASVLKEGLTVNNACEALVLADRHSDDELMKCIVDFVGKNKEVISTEKWDTLQNSNLQLAAKVLREICVK